LGALFLVFGAWFSKTVGGVLGLLALFSLRFFRDGERTVPVTTDLLAPADGTVTEVSDVDGEGYGRGRVIRIFLSVFDGHVQRAPLAGRVTKTHYQPGLFLDARNARAAFANESNAIEIESSKGRVVVRQIAGLIARRIVCWVRPDDVVEAGERIGLIRYGSQVNLYVPLDVEITVKDGDKVSAGQTIVGRWKNAGSSQRAGSADRTVEPAGVGA
ncbi:MAG TPA: phosphatidylserine decarboxylase, partial [Elusimicrobiota bacterium]|nr:phosphatidylserine decarboxylase [Elusimicrobiota bacterium]